MARKVGANDEGKTPPYPFLGAAGLLLTIFGCIVLYRAFVVGKYSNPPLTADEAGGFGQYGEYVVAVAGTIFSFVGVMFLFITFKQQGDSFRLERFESQFFELMKIYRENVQEMKYTPKDADNLDAIDGRMVFVRINEEFSSIFRLLRLFTSFNKIEVKEEDLIAMANLVVFFGLSANGLQSLNYFLEKHQYKAKYPKLTFYITRMLPNSKNSHNKTTKEIYTGHQIRLGHYFRHLFQTVLFVHKQDFLTRQQKYDYIKILRGQMSTFEQAVFFYNSLSPMGWVWEMRYRDIDYNYRINPKTRLRFEVNEHEVNEEDLLITEYRLIKNIPIGFTGAINPRKFYSRLPFEGDTE